MGTIFKKLQPHLGTVAPESVFVEIGSDRGEGSTLELDRLAGLHSVRLTTVDILPNAQAHLSQQLPCTDFVIASGSAWASSYQGPAISCLYLDNFDYIWDINEVGHKPTLIQMAEYADRGLVMSNQNSQIEHMAQMVALYPHLAPGAVVMFDDTYQVNDCWIGKCGPAVVFLQAQGWSIVERTLDCGVILKKT
jgi:hypothetical protein